jgi:cyclophilin family peptidyl-prolyl cis-trans isomerase
LVHLFVYLFVYSSIYLSIDFHSSQDVIDSQFEITLGPLPALDNGDSLVFGIVLEGQAALDAIENVRMYSSRSVRLEIHVSSSSILLRLIT